jgi:hypothetical protein
MTVDDVRYPCSNLVESIIRTHRLESARQASPKGGPQPSRVVILIGELAALNTGVPLKEGVRTIATNRNDSRSILNINFHWTRCVTNTAEGLFGVDHIGHHSWVDIAQHRSLVSRAICDLGPRSCHPSPPPKGHDELHERHY